VPTSAWLPVIAAGVEVWRFELRALTIAVMPRSCWSSATHRSSEARFCLCPPLRPGSPTCPTAPVLTALRAVLPRPTLGAP
jgi:hypothetical protein